MGNIYQDDIGKDIRLETRVDLSSATKTYIKVRKPDGTITTWINTTKLTGQYGETIIRYISVEDDFDQIGEYVLAAYVEWGATSIHYGDPATVIVKEKFSE